MLLSFLLRGNSELLTTIFTMRRRWYEEALQLLKHIFECPLEFVRNKLCVKGAFYIGVENRYFVVVVLWCKPYHSICPQRDVDVVVTGACTASKAQGRTSFENNIVKEAQEVPCVSG